MLQTNLQITHSNRLLPFETSQKFVQWMASSYQGTNFAQYIDIYIFSNTLYYYKKLIY